MPPSIKDVSACSVVAAARLVARVTTHAEKTSDKLCILSSISSEETGLDVTIKGDVDNMDNTPTHKHGTANRGVKPNEI